MRWSRPQTTYYLPSCQLAWCWGCICCEAMHKWVCLSCLMAIRWQREVEGNTFSSQNVELIFLPVHASNNLSELSLLRSNGSTAINFPKDFLCSSWYQDTYMSGEFCVGRGVWLCHGVERERVIAFGMASRTRRKEHSLGFLGNTWRYQGTNAALTIIILFWGKMIVKWLSKIH